MVPLGSQAFLEILQSLLWKQTLANPGYLGEGGWLSGDTELKNSERGRGLWGS